MGQITDVRYLLPTIHQDQALAFYVDGMNLRRIGRTLGIAHQTVANWVKAHAATLSDTLPLPTVPHQVDELDELFTFIGTKKRWYLITQVERGTRCDVSWRVAAERASATLQTVVNAAPSAQWQHPQSPEELIQ